MKKIMPALIAAIVVGGIGFAGGNAYGSSKTVQANTPTFQARSGFQMGMGRRGGMGGGGFANGKILSKDAASLTVELPSGGSKIVFFSPSTKVFKYTEGTASDLKTGETVVVSGALNQDGSVAASMIELRPDRSTSTVPQ